MKGILDRILQAKEYAWTELDLSNEHINSLPKEVVSLGQLRILKLNGNLFDFVPRVVCELTNLKELSLAGNPITSLPNEISKLHLLERFDLNGTLMWLHYCGQQMYKSPNRRNSNNVSKEI